MRKLLQFLYRNNHWFLFILLEVASVILLFRFNSYQHSVYLTSANSVFGKSQELSSSFTSYFHLKAINEELLDRNMDLEKRIAVLENVLRENKSIELEDRLLQNSVLQQYKLYSAHVVQNSIVNVDNFITINKGSKDGILPDVALEWELGIDEDSERITFPHRHWNNGKLLAIVGRTLIKEYEALKTLSKKIGIKNYQIGPLVRSSYQAKLSFEKSL